MQKRAKTSLLYDQIYDFAMEFKINHNGNSPTIREIGDAVGVSSTSMVSRYLDRMVSRGLIERGGKFRMIIIPGSRWLPPQHTITKITAKELERQDAEKIFKFVRN